MGGFGKSLDAGWANVQQQFKRYTAEIGATDFSVSTTSTGASVPRASTSGHGATVIQNITIERPVDSYSDGLRAMRDIQRGLAW
jgi:hypothetical protein